MLNIPKFDSETFELASSHRVLVVDDDPMMGEFLGAILEELSDVKVVTSGEDALAELRQHEFDVVLLDIEMPGKSGLEICKEIKNDPELANVSVIIVTGHTGDEMEIDALDLGATDFIVKPFVAKIVIARVRNHLMMQSQARQLRLLTMRDGLTGLANRRCYDQSIIAECRRAKRGRAPMSLLLIDIDHFKKFNDNYGHLKGDDCLRIVANTLAQAARRAGELVARIGGEEFAIILPATNAEQLETMALSLTQAVKNLGIQHVHGIDGVVTISIGGVTKQPDDPLLSEIPFYQEADIQLYRAKELGRNKYVVS